MKRIHAPAQAMRMPPAQPSNRVREAEGLISANSSTDSGGSRVSVRFVSAARSFQTDSAPAADTPGTPGP